MLEYQGVPVEDISNPVEQCKKHVLADVERLQERLKE